MLLAAVPKPRGPRVVLHSDVVERKLATVLFVDLVGLDRARDRRAIPRSCAAVSTRSSTASRTASITHGGIVEKFAGDAVMAAFGIPQAHEDDAERAVRAALAILDAVDELGLEARDRRRGGRGRRRRRPSRRSRPARRSTSPRGSQQAAEPGEIVLGPVARRLTLGARRGRGRRAGRDARACRADLGLARGLATTAPAAPSARSRRRSSAARPSSSCSRTRSSARSATGARTSSRSTASPGSARAGSRASSRAASRARPCSPAAAFPTARASRTGRSPRWSSSRPGSRTTTRSTRRSRSSAPAARTRRSPTCSRSPSGVLEAVEAERSQQEIAWAAREWARASSPRRSRSCSSSRTSTGPRSRCSS